jgi:hypothetical protein
MDELIQEGEITREALEWSEAPDRGDNFHFIVKQALKAKLLDDTEYKKSHKVKRKITLEDGTKAVIIEEKEKGVLIWNPYKVVKFQDNENNVETCIKISDWKNIAPSIKNPVLRNLKIVSIGKPKDIDTFLYDLKIKRKDNK